MLFLCLVFNLALLNILKVNIDPASGSYTFSVNGVKWFSSGPTGYVSEKKWILTPQTLRMKNISVTQGKDMHDSYTKTTIMWSTSSTPQNPDYVTSFIEYQNIDVVLFEQEFPNGLSETSYQNKNTDLSTMFPSFQSSLPGTTDLHYASNHDTFCSPVNGKWNDLTFTGGALSGPIALYTNETTILMSPANTFMVGNYIGEKIGDVYTLGAGLQGKVNSIPPGFMYRSMIVGSNHGVPAAYFKWGDYLLAEYSKRRAKVSDDVFLSKLGYWTDNGAYYYYLTQDGKNYEDTILDVWSDIQKRILPVGNIQYDSWWYFRSKDDNGVYLWEPRYV